MGGDHMWIALGPVGLGSGVLPINVVVMEGIAVRAKTLVVVSSRRGEWVKQSPDYLPNAPVNLIITSGNRLVVSDCYGESPGCSARKDREIYWPHVVIIRGNKSEITGVRELRRG